MRQSRRLPRISRLIAAYTAGLCWAGAPQAAGETFPALAARLSSIAVLHHAGRPLACLHPVPSASASAIAQFGTRLASPSPTVSLEHPHGLLVGIAYRRCQFAHGYAPRRSS